MVVVSVTICPGNGLGFDETVVTATQRFGVFRRSSSAWEWNKPASLERDELFIAQADAFLGGLHGKPTDLCTFDEAVHCLETVAAEYEHQCRLARALAEEYFDAPKVVGRVLERALA